MPGKVVFDFGNLCDPTTGKEVKVSGELPKILPPFQYDINMEKLESSKKFLTNWISQYFQTDSNPKYFKSVVPTATIRVASTYPFQPIGSPKFNFALKYFAFGWIMDDTFESCIKNKLTITERVFEVGLASIESSLTKGVATFGSVEMKTFPRFHELSNASLQLFQDFEEFGFTKKSKQNCDLFHQYVQSLLSYFRNSIDETMSEETFRELRASSSYVSGGVEINWILESDVGLPLEILKSDTLKRVWFLVNAIGAFTNDILGMKADLQHDGFDNFLVFKVVHKKIPITEAVTQVIQIIEEDTAEYFKCKQNMLEEFSYHPELVRYFNVIEALLYGNYLMYIYSKRYYSTESVKLTL